MRRLYRLITMLLLLIFVSNGGNVRAINTQFSFEQLTAEEKREYIANIDMSLLKAEPIKRPIVCFDVNDDQMIAIGQDAPDKKIVCIYTSDGVFQYAYAFHCSGSFGIAWDESNLNIYFARGGMILAVDPNGEIIDLVKIQDTAENNAYQNHMLYSTERISGNTKYRIRNDMGILNLIQFSYSQLAAIQPTGEEKILYDVNSAQLAKTITVCVLAMALLLVTVAVSLGNLRDGKIGTDNADHISKRTSLKKERTIF